MAGTVQKLTNTTFSGSGLPYLERDALATTGTLALYDLVSGASYSGPTTPPNGTIITDLSRAGNNASLVVGANPITHDGRGLLMPDQASYTPSAYLTRNALPVAARNWVGVMWVRARISGTNPGTNNFQGLAGQSAVVDAYNANNSWHMWLRTGVAFKGQVGYTVAGSNTVPALLPFGAAALVDGELLQIGVSCVAAGGNLTISTYLNGALSNTVTVSGATALQATTSPLVIGATVTSNSQGKSRVYRVLVEDLTTSGRAALSVVQADYAANLSRFT